MNFPWSHYLELAKALAGQETDSVASQEARLRSAISRAYYAVFCTARNRAHAQGRHVTPQANPHREVQEYFRQSTDHRRRRIGLTLQRLRIKRNKADYDDSISGLPALTTFVVRSAERLLGELIQL